MSREHSLGCLSPDGFHRVVYGEWGDPDNPRVLVCVHGLTRNGRDFDTLAAGLSDRYRVLCPDVVGRGRSDWLATKSLYGYPQYLADMAALIARSGADTVDWLGTSMGGLIGMLLASQPGTPIRRLVLNDVGPFVPASAIERIASYVGLDPRFPDRDALDAYLRQIYAPFGPFTDAQWASLVDSTVRTTPEGDIALSYDPGIAEPFAATHEDVDLWPVWDRVSAPSLALRGSESDVLTASIAEQMCERGPRAELHEFPGIGHAPSLMSDAEVTLIGEWLGAS